ncbi:MAG: CheR family methyltransferase [Sulfurimonas sp.]|nr:CheR family methyltransferase [Sulfurimonas sp.]
MFKSTYSDFQSQIEELFLHRLGWQLSLDNKYSDEKMLKICKTMGFAEMSECLMSFNDNKHSQGHVQTLAREFSIGESYFFRDKKFFDTLEHKIIPQLLKEKDPHDKNINIWSVGCSSGEEIYSVSMILHKNIPDISKWNIFLLGTDVNIDFLEKAKSGVYSDYSLRDMPQYYKKQYFKELNNIYEISPLIKKNVHFEYHNIIEEKQPLPSKNIAFDLILLKNVLIYFDKEKARGVIDFLYKNLKTGGYLSTTPIEYSSDIFNSYRAKNFSSESIIQKSDIADIESSSSQPLADSLQYEKTSQTVEPSVEKTVLVDGVHSNYTKACELLEAGDTQEAKKHLRKCLYLDNNFIVGLITLGNIFKKEGDNENASRYLNRARELLYKMEPSAVVTFSDNMTVDELLGIINHKIKDL